MTRRIVALLIAIVVIALQEESGTGPLLAIWASRKLA